MNTRPVTDRNRSSNQFTYDALSSPELLRLLKVLPDKAHGRVQVEMWEARTPTPYRCLSYTWGDQTHKTEIWLNNRVMQVGMNLLEFLEMATQRFPNENLWIDALCINQSNNKEKSIQVQQMAVVYQQADEVLVWLGNDQAIAGLFNWCRKPPSKLNKALRYLPVERTPIWLRSAATKLAQHPYWTRAWIIQEIKLARTARFLCDFSETDADGLGKCTTGLLRNNFKGNNMEEVFDNIPDRVLDFLYVPLAYPLGFTLALSYGASRAIDFLVAREYRLKAVVNFLNKAPPTQAQRAQVPTTIWWIFDENAQCQDERDRIYSILALTGHHSTFVVNYEESRLDLLWRSVNQFGAWYRAWEQAKLWTALGFDRGSFTEAILQARDETLNCTIALRRCEIVKRRGFIYGRPDALVCEGMAETDEDVHVMHDIEDLLLCPTPAMDNHDASNAHFILRRGAEDAYQIYCQGAWSLYKPFLCSGGTELWYSMDGAKVRIAGWEEAVRIAKLGGRRHENWSSKPHFVLKLTHHYVVDLVDDFLQSAFPISEHRWQLSSDPENPTPHVVPDKTADEMIHGARQGKVGLAEMRREIQSTVKDLLPGWRQEAIIHKAPGILKVRRDLSCPLALEDDQVMILTKAVALNRADWQAIDEAPAPGSIAGCDYAGEVMTVGKDVTQYKQGDRICGLVRGGMSPFQSHARAHT